MYQLNFLNKENDLNKIIKKHKKERNNLSILFVSLWDKYSTSLVDQLKDKYKENKEGEPLFIVDSFFMPHSFVIYNTTKIPHLIQLRRDGADSDDYLSIVMRKLRV